MCVFTSTEDTGRAVSDGMIAANVMSQTLLQLVVALHATHVRVVRVVAPTKSEHRLKAD